MLPTLRSSSRMQGVATGTVWRHPVVRRQTVRLLEWNVHENGENLSESTQTTLLWTHGDIILLSLDGFTVEAPHPGRPELILITGDNL